MGARGRGALLTKKARLKARRNKRDLPWKNAKLSRVAKVIAFLEFLPVTKGICAGQNMELLDEQRGFVKDVYGPLRKDGRRVVSIGIESEPKGNGKTGLAAGLALCHLLGPEAEVRGECYSAAMDREQAGIIFREMEAIIVAVPEFACRVNLQRFNKRIEVLEGDGKGSTYEALSSDAKKAHGLAPSFWVYDELAQASERELLDNLMEGMGKRKEALGLIISTQARDDDHVLSQLIDDALTGEDPSIIVRLLTVPPEADVYDVKVLRKVNPAWGKFLDTDDVIRSMNRAKRMPAFEPAYRNLRCNQRVDAGSEARVISGPVWMTCAADVVRKKLAGRKCFGALDLSGKNDLTALVLGFPSEGKEPVVTLLPFFWTPEGQLENRRDRERELFERWINEGHLIAMKGNVIRTSAIVREIGKLKQEFQITAIGYDRWRIDDFKADMEDEGLELPLEPFGQGFKDMSPAIEFFTELALSGRLKHGSHPVLTSHMAGAIVVSDASDNKKIDKARSQRRATSRIDGAVTTVMVCGVMKRYVPKEGEKPPMDMDDFLKNMVAV